MNLRIGEREPSAATTPVRPGAAAGRSKSALSDIARDGGRAPADVGVVIRLSPDAQKLLAREAEDNGQSSPGSSIDAGETDGATRAGAAPSAGPKPLTAEDKQLVSRLATRDTAVRAHEAAHQAAARGLSGAASFSYETGPDGRRYAVGGEVPVSIRPGRTPNETIANAQVVRAAALAPADPSSQDMAVAAQASQMEAEARQQVTKAKAHGGDGDSDPTVKDATKAKAVVGDPVSKVPGSEAQVGGAGKDKAAPDVDGDSLMIFSTLKAERGSIVNGHTHAAAGGACAICSRAAARYA